MNDFFYLNTLFCNIALGHYTRKIRSSNFLHDVFTFGFIHTYNLLLSTFYYRLLLAALHFNSNGSREVAQTSDGEVYYAVRYPRFRKGGWVVRPVKEKPSYG